MRYIVIASALMLLIFLGCSTHQQPLMSVAEEVEVASPPPPAPPPPAPPPPMAGEFESNQGHGYPIPPRPMRDQELAQTTRPSAAYKKIPSIDQATEQVSEQLFNTSAAITGDTAGNIEDTLNISLIIDPSVDKESLREQLESENPNAKITVTDTRISALAWPELIAPDFTVTPAVASEQAVTGDGPTEWTWQLKPRAGGEFTVLVDLYAIVYVGDKQTKRKYKTLRQPITITVPEVPWYMNVWAWMLDNWDKVWTLMLIPVVGYVYNRFRKKKKR